MNRIINLNNMHSENIPPLSHKPRNITPNSNKTPRQTYILTQKPRSFQTQRKQTIRWTKSRKPLTTQSHVPYPSSPPRIQNLHILRKKPISHTFPKLVIRNTPNPQQRIIHETSDQSTFTIRQL